MKGFAVRDARVKDISEDDKTAGFQIANQSGKRMQGFRIGAVRQRKTGIPEGRCFTQMKIGNKKRLAGRVESGQFRQELKRGIGKGEEHPGECPSLILIVADLQLPE